MFHRMHDVRRDSEVEKYVFNFYFIKLPFTAILFGIIVNIILGGFHGLRYAKTKSMSHLICLLLISFQCLVFVLMTLGFDVDYQRNLSLTIGLALTNYYTLQWGKSMRRHIGRGRVIFIRCSCYILWALYFAAGVISTTVVTVPLFYFLTEVGISWAIVACTAHGIYMAGAFYSIGITIWYFTLLPKAAPLHDRIKKTQVRRLLDFYGILFLVTIFMLTHAAVYTPAIFIFYHAVALFPSNALQHFGTSPEDYEELLLLLEASASCSNPMKPPMPGASYVSINDTKFDTNYPMRPVPTIVATSASSLPPPPYISLFNYSVTEKPLSKLN